MKPQRRQPLTGMLIAELLLILIMGLVAPSMPGLAQDVTPTAGTAATEIPAGTPGVEHTPTITLTPTITPTPTETPTPTPTFTELQARMTLAQTYLDGGNYAKAAEIFAAIALEDRGNAEALAGLNAALKGQEVATATAAAPPPTAVPTATPLPPPGPTFGGTFAAKWRELAGTALPGLLLLVVLYWLAKATRWTLSWVRETWLMRGLPWLGRAAVSPGFLLGEFTDATNIKNFQGPRIIALALTEKLLAWNQLVQAKAVPVEPAPSLELGGMSWIKVLWDWILPPPRGYKVTGTLLGDQSGVYRLSVQRIALSNNSVDAGHTFEAVASTPEQAFREMGGEAAKWLLSPQDMEASEAAMRGMRAKGPVEALQLTASEIFDQALDLLLPVRQQVTQGEIDFADARRRLRKAEELLAQLPSGSSLRADLQGVIADLRRSVPGPDG